MQGEWILNAEARKIDRINEEATFGRYPHGFRHYESFANYKIVNPRSEISEYMEIMNRQIEFDEFLALMRQAAVEEAEDPHWQTMNNPEKDFENDEDMGWEEAIESEIFEKEARVIYEQKT